MSRGVLTPQYPIGRSFEPSREVGAAKRHQEAALALYHRIEELVDLTRLLEESGLPPLDRPAV